MLYKSKSIDSITGRDLDTYLAHGYYRSCQHIFTTDFLPYEGSVYPVIWLRYPLRDLKLPAKCRSILRRAAAFQVTVKEFAITDELDELYAYYRSAMDFEASPTLHSYLIEEAGAFDYEYDDELAQNAFNSRTVEIRDGEKLIAAGVFDLGDRSIAGILNFYDPDYSQYSLGKVCILEKLRYAQQAGFDYYYPGYLAYNHSKFDYKLFPGMENTEMLAYGEWVPFDWEVVQEIGEAWFLDRRLRSRVLVDLIWRLGDGEEHRSRTRH
jgi:leucyl-tRNA---protein transferase